MTGVILCFYKEMHFSAGLLFLASLTGSKLDKVPHGICPVFDPIIDPQSSIST